MLLRSHAEATRNLTETTEQQCRVIQDSLVETEKQLAALRTEVLEKRNRLHEATRGRKISPELVSMLEGDLSNAKPAVRAELRERLEAGWDASPGYVLVRKEVLKDLDFPRLVSAARVTDIARDILALSSAEEAAINSTAKRIGSGKTLRVERTDPAGDVVAQYTALPLDSALEQQLSNTFITEISGILGPERSPLLGPQAWREIRSDLAPREPETLIVRRSVVDGEPDVAWEEYRGSKPVASSQVRYAHYPSGWFLAQFPGGWKTLADREGFELPRRFRSQPGH
jgi:hypothetical protein